MASVESTFMKNVRFSRCNQNRVFSVHISAYSFQSVLNKTFREISSAVTCFIEIHIDK